jgi:tRNA nucleotidyltransferase/poly(A) polymerase
MRLEAEWLRSAHLRAVLDALDNGAFFVGGCVRNTLLGQPVADIDITTPIVPAEVTRRLEAAGLGAVPTGIEHGTVMAVSGGEGFEITTFRADVATDGRRATVRRCGGRDHRPAGRVAGPRGPARPLHRRSA